MRVTRFASAAVGLALAGSVAAHGQSAPAPARILAIGTLVADADLAKVRAILPIEARETVRLYLAGEIEQWFSLRDRKGVVFILNKRDLASAAAMLEKLPLGQARLMHFDLMPIGPLEPLGLLQATPAGTP